MKPGVHKLSIEEYHAIDGVSRSKLAAFRRSPKHYYDEYENENRAEETQPDIITSSHALSFGNAVHAYILEQSDFENQYIVVEKPNRSSNAGKKAFEELKFSANGRKLLCKDSFNDILAMKQSIDENIKASTIISSARSEQSLFWQDRETGLLCKARPDIWSTTYVADLKTCTNGSYREFQRAVFAHDYHIQAAMIHTALKELYNINMLTFFFVVVEKTRPFVSAVYQLDQSVLEYGIEQFHKSLYEMRVCLEQNLWMGYQDAIITLPSYL